jgi:hypothetical protein
MSETKMRAKVRVGSVIPLSKDLEVVTFHGVSKSGGYPADGSDEDNSFAKFSPSVDFKLSIANPALIGTFEPGQTFYCDFVAVPTT